MLCDVNTSQRCSILQWRWSRRFRKSHSRWWLRGPTLSWRVPQSMSGFGEGAALPESKTSPLFTMCPSSKRYNEDMTWGPAASSIVGQSQPFFQFRQGWTWALAPFSPCQLPFPPFPPSCLCLAKAWAVQAPPVGPTHASGTPMRATCVKSEFRRLHDISQAARI